MSAYTWRWAWVDKTIVTLTAVQELIYNRSEVGKVLVIAPKKVAEGTWAAEAAKWDHTKGLRVSLATGTAAQRRKALYMPADVYIITRECTQWAVQEFKHRWPFDMVVIDESTSFKSHQAKRFRALASIRPHIARLVELTGTPSPNNIADLWAQIYLLDGGERLEKTYTAFRSRYMKPDSRGYDGTIYSYKPVQGATEAVLEKIRDLCISMKAADYLDLPDIVYDDRVVVLDPEAQKAYEKMESDMVLELADAEIDAMSAAALTGKLLQLSNGAVYDSEHAWHEVHRCKLEALAELIETLVEGGQSVLVFYQYRHDLERITAELKGYRVRCMSGPEDIEAWNGGRLDVLLAHPASAAYGLNLQAGGSHIVWFGLTWNYEQFVQANARLHRQGQEHTVFVHQLIVKGTRDEDVRKALCKKDGAQAYVMDSLKARVEKIRRGKK